MRTASRVLACVLAATGSWASAQDSGSPSPSERLKDLANQAVLGQVKGASDINLKGVLSADVIQRLETRAAGIDVGKTGLAPAANREVQAISEELRARLAFKSLATVASLCGESLASASQFQIAADAPELDTALRDKVQRALGLRALAASILRPIKPDVVCDGSATDLTPHPEPKPVGFKNDTGKSSSAKAGHLEEQYKASGFKEVVALLYRGKFTCSATMISSRWLLTAAHCVSDENDRGKLFEPKDLAYVVYTETGTDCFTSDDTQGRTMSLCGRKKRAVLPVIIPADGWTASAHQPGFPSELDRALIQIDHEDQTAGANVKVVAALPPGVSDITIAGYGFTASAQDVPGDIISIGWNKLNSKGAADGVFQWQYLTPGGQSSTCHGDSGGPLMLGRQHGEPNEKHAIFAVVSNLEIAKANDPNAPVFPGVAASCLQRVATNSLISNEAALKWLCKNAGPKVDGCNAPHVIAYSGSDRQ